MTASIESMRDDFEVGSAGLHQITMNPDDRHRKDYGDVEAMSKSMKDEVGIIQPLAVKRIEGSDKFMLLAGGRRFLSALKAGIKSVPVRIYPANLDEHQQALIEHMENVYRKDFNVEEALFSAEAVHKAKIAIHGEKIAKNKDAPGWTQAMTADLLNIHPTQVSDMLELASAAKKNPEIAKAKSMAEAKRIHKSIEATKNRSSRAAEAHEKAKGEDPKAEKLSLCDCYTVQDCIGGMKKLPAKSFDIAEIDPPYAMDYAEARKHDGSTTTLNYNEVSKEDYLNFMDSVIAETVRCLKDDAWLILWHANEWESAMHELLEKHGLACRMLPAVWAKEKAVGTTAQPKRYLARGYEQFLYAAKGKAEIYKQGRSDMFLFPSVHSAHRVHPTERPVEMVQEVLSTFAGPGSFVLVPFAGSGNTLLAASNLYMQAIGFDLTKVYKDAFTLRVLQGELHNYSSYKGK